MKITRRTVLKVGGGAAVVVAGGAVGLGLRETVLREPRRPLKVLTQVEFSVLAAMADRMAPGHGDWPSPWDLEIPEDIDELLTTVHPEDVAGLKEALAGFESAHVGFILDGRTNTFTGQDAEDQDDSLEDWRSSWIQTRRGAYRALHRMVSAAYYGSPRVWPLLGYPGPPKFS